MSATIFKNDSTAKIALFIDNNNEIMASINKGLLVSAMRYVGKSPRKSSYPFITSVVKPKDQRSNAILIENEELKNKYLKRGNNESAKYVFGISLQSGIVREIIFAEKRLGDTGVVADDVDEKEILAHILSKNWSSALEKISKPRFESEGPSV